MAIIQISRIQIRRGPEADLPGAPTSLSPLTFSEALEAGEFGFATDSGRLFIGHDPKIGQANYARTAFPYQNVEVLTENSQEMIDRLFASVLRATGREAFSNASLAQTGDGVWNPVVEGAAPFRFPGPNLAASIEYNVFTASNQPVRHGVLRVAHPGDNTEPSVIDDAVSHARYLVGSDSDYDPEVVFGSVRFRFAVVTEGGTDYYRFEYQNRLGANLKLFFRYTRVAP